MSEKDPTTAPVDHAALCRKLAAHLLRTELLAAMRRRGYTGWQTPGGLLSREEASDLRIAVRGLFPNDVGPVMDWMVVEFVAAGLGQNASGGGDADRTVREALGTAPEIRRDPNPDAWRPGTPQSTIPQNEVAGWRARSDAATSSPDVAEPRPGEKCPECGAVVFECAACQAWACACSGSVEPCPGCGRVTCPNCGHIKGEPAGCPWGRDRDGAPGEEPTAPDGELMGRRDALYLRERIAHRQGFHEGYAAAIEAVRRGGGEAFMNGHDAMADACRKIVGSLKSWQESEAGDRYAELDGVDFGACRDLLLDADRGKFAKLRKHISDLVDRARGLENRGIGDAPEERLIDLLDIARSEERSA